ncbi:MAG TPA: zf-HC2 domain-containing protein [Actinomycetota bacterium]|nr:zf-HC2 domain-containing protein [Actinomycetota bacterium]
MTCLEVRDLLAEYAVDGLEAAERRRVEHHLGSCPGCGKEVEELREGAAAVALELFAAPPPEGLEDKVAGAVRHQARRKWLRRRRSARVLVAAAAAAALLSAGAIGGAVAMRGQVSNLKQQVHATRISLEQVQSIVQALATNARVYRTDLNPVAGRIADQGGTGILFTAPNRDDWIFVQVLVAHPGTGPYRVLLEQRDGTRVEAGELEPAGRNEFVLFSTKGANLFDNDPSQVARVVILDPAGKPLLEGSVVATTAPAP